MLYVKVTAAEVRERVARLLTERPRGAHLAPIFAAIADGLAVVIAAQTRDAFRVPKGRPAVVVIGDDTDTSLGPCAFHQSSLRRVLRRAAGIAVMAGAPKPEVYALAPKVALALGATMVLVECRETTEATGTPSSAKPRPACRA